MSMSNAFETDLLELFFQGVAIADLAENDATSPATQIHASLHTADPGEAGTMLTSQAAYTSYARVAVARTAGGWAVSGNAVTPVAEIVFPQATGGSETETHCGFGVSSTNYLMFSGTISPTIAVSSGVQPRLTTATSISLD